MAAATNKVRILLIRPWTEPLAPLRAALRDAGVEARISRVDIEPALNAALARTRFDLVVLDPKTNHVTLDTVTACLRQNRRFAPIIVLESVPAFVERVKHALAERLN